MKKAVVLALLAVTLLFPQDNWKKVKIFPSTTDGFARLEQLSAGLDEAFPEKDGSVSMFISTSDFAKLKTLGMPYEVVIDDWHAYYASLPVLTPEEKDEFIQQNKQQFGVEGFGYGSMGGFYTFQEAVNQLDSMYARYPNLITPKFQIGTTENGRPIWAVKISDNPNQDEGEPQALFDGLIHAREPISMMTVIYYMYYLCENYGTNPEVTYLVNNREIFFVPVLNPDGYEYNRQTDPNGGGFWRKNRRNNGGSYGVDLNRNFGYMWGYDNSGSSPNPPDEDYRGPSAFSEPELAGYRNFVNTKNFKTYINFHSFQNAMLYPWGYINAQTPDNAIYEDFCSYMAQFNGYVYGNGGTVLGYNSNGSARDWFYGEQTTKPKAFGYTFEIGSSSDNFWPPQSRIFPLAQGNLRPLLFKSWVAGEYVSFFAPRYDRPYFNPGETVSMKPVFKNRGLSAANEVSVELQSLSPSIAVVSGAATLQNLASMDTAAISGQLSFSIASDAGISQQHAILIKTVKGGATMSIDTLKLALGVPNYAFIDTTLTPVTNWDLVVTPTTSPKWDATTTSFVTAPVSFTDSKTGTYVANLTSTMTTKNAIDLTTVNNPKLVFWLKYDIESNYDYAQVMISTNGGTSFTPLAGKYTEPSSGSFQPPNQPVYDGVRTNWVQEEISLAPYSGQQIKLRFMLKTDGSQQKDGIYLDDIGIVGYSVVPVEMVSFSGAVSAGGNPVLSWKVASELNNKGFTIERRNSEGGWNASGFIEGRGTVTEPKEYSFEDFAGFTGETSVHYRLIQTDFDGTRTIFGPLEVMNTLPSEFSLSQNHPNPFNPETVIRFSLPFAGHAKCVVYDMLGREVATLLNGIMPAGNHSLKFNATELPSGVYIFRLEAGKHTAAIKMVVNK